MHQGIVSGRQNRTDAEVEARVQRMAGGFKALGIGQGDCVAILMRNDIASQIPNARFHVVPRASHMLTLSSPVELAKVLSAED